MKKDKCHFCEHDYGPLMDVPEACSTCCEFDNFQAKKKMHPKQAYEYKKLQEREELINDRSIEFDRATALRVLQDLSANMMPNFDLFGRPILTIHRQDFEAVRKKYLDKPRKEKEKRK